MLHVLTSTSPTPSDALLQAMFAARKSVFVDLLKWDVPVIDDRYEVDQFDNRHARYLVLADETGAHLGSTRLLPTSRPHILDTLYPALCEDAPPTGARVYEITRFCLDRRLRAFDRRAVRDTLVSALVDYALANDIGHYTAIAELGWFQQILAFGWHCIPLGLPRVLDGATLAALSIAITDETPALLATAGIRAREPILPERQLAAA